MYNKATTDTRNERACRLVTHILPWILRKVTWGCIDGAFNVWTHKKDQSIEKQGDFLYFFLYHPPSMGCISCGWENNSDFFHQGQLPVGIPVAREGRLVCLCSYSEKTGSHRWVVYFSDPSYLFHYEHQRQDEETICPLQDGDLDSQANKTLTVWELLLSLNGWTAEKDTVCRCLR